jgi:hypothetical protein
MGIRRVCQILTENQESAGEEAGRGSGLEGKEATGRGQLSRTRCEVGGSQVLSLSHVYIGSVRWRFNLGLHRRFRYDHHRVVASPHVGDILVGLQIVVPESVHQILEAVFSRGEFQGQTPNLPGPSHGMRLLIPIVEIAGQKDLLGLLRPELERETTLITLAPYHCVPSPPEGGESKSLYRKLEMIVSDTLNIALCTGKSRRKFAEFAACRNAIAARMHHPALTFRIPAGKSALTG